MKLKLTEIRRDDSAQPRAMLNTDHIKDLSDALGDGGDLTPVDVFHDGHSYWLADGFHRWSAYHRANREEIPVTVHEGDLRQAVLYSITVNAKHAVLKLTRNEKRASVERLLRDEEWSQWSNREIAKRAGVSEFLVRQMRETDCDKSQSNVTADSLGQESVTSSKTKSDVRKGADGRTINTANIGKVQPEIPKSDLSDYTRERYSIGYKPPVTPDEPEQDDRPEMMLTEEDEGDDPNDFEDDDVGENLFATFTPIADIPEQANLRVKPDDPSKRRPFVRAFTAAGELSNTRDEVIVAALLSPENTTPPTKGSLELEFQMVVDKINRCLAMAERERKTLTV